MRRLLLHMGAGKTGTSVLQLFWELHREWLAQHGIWYPPGPLRPDPATKISTGNGDWLFAAVARGEPWELFLDQVSGAPSDGDVLISSELLAYAEPSAVAELRRQLAAVGFQLHPFYLVRNPDEWYLSAYQQNVKRNAYIEPFPTFCRTYPLEFQLAIDHVESVLGEGAVHLLSYEAGKADVVGYVLRHALGITAAPPAFSNPTINRSLTPFELEWLRATNAAHLAAGLSHEEARLRGTRLSDSLIALRPTIPAASKYQEPMPDDVAERLCPVVDSLNRRLPEGPLRIALAQGSAALSDDQRATARCLAEVMARERAFVEPQQPAVRRAWYQPVRAALRSIANTTRGRRTSATSPALRSRKQVPRARQATPSDPSADRRPASSDAPRDQRQGRR